MQKILFLFDIDGTLLTSGGAGSKAMEKAFEKVLGIKEACKGINFIGATDTLIFRNIFNKYNIPFDVRMEKTIRKQYLIYLEYELGKSDGFKVFEGVNDLLCFLTGCKYVELAIATGNMEKGAKEKLKRGGLESFFKTGSYDEDGSERSEIVKSAILKSLKQNKNGFKKIFYVGDSLYDLNAAKINKINSIIVGHSGFLPEKNKAKPDYYLKNLKNISFFREIVV